MKPFTAITLAVGLLTVLGFGAGALVVLSGAYNVAATTQHWQPVYSLLEIALRRSVQLRARDIETPVLEDAQRIARGAVLFQDTCAQCHGAPGLSPGDIGKSMQPLPGPLVNAVQRWRPREIYWITREGIKMSGMPAWTFRLNEEQLWDVVAFVQRLPDLTPQAYAQATKSPKTAVLQTGAADIAQGPANVERGRLAMYQYACSSCHSIPGITGSSPNVGAPLKGLAGRSLLAGRLPNTPDNLIQWLRYPKTIKPLTAMPDLGVTEPDARDMAAFLATLH